MAATAQKVELVIFYSKGKNLRLVRRPKNRELLPSGQQRTTDEGLRYLFAPDGFVRLYPGEDTLPDGPYDPVTETFAKQDAITWLRNHWMLNQFFWEEGNEVDRPKPVEKDYLSAVNRAIATRDVTALVMLREQEMGSHRRQILLDAVENAIDTVQSLEPVVAEGASSDPPESERAVTGAGPDAPVEGSSAEPFDDFPPDIAALSREEMIKELNDLGVTEIPDLTPDETLRYALLQAREE